MMRFHQPTTAALAALFVLPAAAQLGLGKTLDLQGRLAATARAIEGLLGIEDRLSTGDTRAIEDVLAATEPPILDGPGRDLVLGELRREVGKLHEALDELALSEGGAGLPIAGLTDAERASLREMQSAGRGTAQVATASSGETAGAEPWTAFEKDPTYTADQVRQARLMIRAGRELEAIELLEYVAELPDDKFVEARYWLARAYDRAEQYDRALALYDELAADDDAGKYRERANLDRGFLVVKKRLLEEREAARAEQGEDE